MMPVLLGWLAVLSSDVVMGSESAAESFKKNEVVPDVLPSNGDNLHLLSVSYGNQKATPGNELTPTQVQHQPTVSWEADTNKLYTLIMTDPDAPSRENPIRREFKHWLVINIPGDEVDKGYPLAAYIGAGPPQGTGLHRYVFLVYEQPKKLEEGEQVSNTSVKDRPKFKAAKWAEEQGLKGPIAGNLFQAQFDDYVPKLHASFHQ